MEWNLIPSFPGRKSLQSGLGAFVLPSYYYLEQIRVFWVCRIMEWEMTAAVGWEEDCQRCRGGDFGFQENEVD